MTSISDMNKYDEVYEEVDVLDLISNTWCERKPLPGKLLESAAVLLNSTIFVTCGACPDGKTSCKSFKYDIPTDTWIPCQDVPGDIVGERCISVVGSKVYICDYKDFLMYDVDSDTWATLEKPPVPTFHAALVLWGDDDLLLMGGYTRTNHQEGHKNPNHQIQRYSINKGTWTVENEVLPQALSFHYAFVMEMEDGASVSA